MEDWNKKEPRFCCMLLDRLRQDCEYYLRIGGSANCLWADSEKEQIQTMIDIWNSFPDGDRVMCVTFPGQPRGFVIKQYYPTACPQQTQIICDDGRVFHAPTGDFVKI